ncbi:hypothetical protein ACEE23_03575 [Corynebacterium sp. 32222D000AT]|uniref:hypothetical protein n=1 Tax=unclassified Corynebacterium TaxID=2624378 RepID=UPI002A944420|nr:hypothetical protein [Mycobacteriaceae bacterium]MDY5828752.1 hypothetical protein [Corynebacterium sp.]
MAFAGNIIGATVLAYGWDHWGIYDALVANAIKFNFYESWGPWLALIASLAALGLWWLAQAPLRTDRRGRLDAQYGKDN